MRFLITFLSVTLLLGMIISCNQMNKKTENEAKAFLGSFEKEIIPLYIGSNKAYYAATISGKDEDYTKTTELGIKLSKIYANKEKFEKVKEYRNSGNITDSLLKRELDVLYNAMITNQIDTNKLEKIIKSEVDLERKYSTFRAEVNGKKVPDNEIENILANSTNSAELEKVWLASKEIGDAVDEDIKELVKLRNEVAHDLGYNNYHEMSLKTSDQDPGEVVKLFDELDELTRDAFAELKNEMDNILAAKYKINKKDLMPWHYQNRFFQEAPKIYDVDLNTYYKGKDILEIVKKYYSSIGFDVEDILANSDLFEKEGKNQHAYCTSIDKAGDIRILANIRDNYNWMNTMLHELGHAVYDKHIDRNLPFLLRDPAHIFTTEAVANFFGMLASNAKWMKHNIRISNEEMQSVAKDMDNYSRLERLVFSRWSQVMFRFEKSMYENPEQDLNDLWWSLVEKYQLLKRPKGRDKPDWASKIHIATSPCYYHNYLLGDLLASQFNAYLETHIIGHKDICYTGHPEVGEFFKEKVFKPGSRYHWNVMIEKATGEKLTAKYYAEEFVN